MERSVADPVALPYTLSRPFFKFFRAFSLALLVIIALSGLAAGVFGFFVALTVGAALWLGLSLGILFNRQSVTLLPDHLLFQSAGKRYRLFYNDIQQVRGELVLGMISVNQLYLWIYHTGVDKSPVDVNLRLYAARDRALLVRVLERLAPHAVMNSEAREILSGNLR